MPSYAEPQLVLGFGTGRTTVDSGSSDVLASCSSSNVLASCSSSGVSAGSSDVLASCSSSNVLASCSSSGVSAGSSSSSSGVSAGSSSVSASSSCSSVFASTSRDLDSRKTSELVSGVGLKKDRMGNENTPQEPYMFSDCPPQKRQKVKEKDFAVVRRPRLFRESESGVSWNALPDELILAIFAYLPLSDLIRASVVCKRWHGLSFDESLWQSLDLAGRNLQPGVIGQLLPAGVTVFRCPRSCIGNPMLKTTKPLKVQHMDLSNCTVSVEDLQSILCLCESLQNLSLEGLVLSDEIVKSLAKNTGLIRLNLSGCSGFSAEALELMLSCCSSLDELNLSWCDFTATHVRTAVSHITEKVTQLNLSGYRENLEITDVQILVERCPYLIHLDLSDSVVLKPDCFQYFRRLLFLQHLCLSRCYQITPAALVELGAIPTLKTLQVFGIVTETSLKVLRDALPDININCSHLTTIARPTVGSKRNHDIWGLKCRLKCQFSLKLEEFPLWFQHCFSRGH
ncbi:S-phase kinase-associated protein 2 [Phaethornis superciliosus]